MNNKMVNIINIEKSLIKISFDVISELSINNNISKKLISNGLLYTVYREFDNSIKIGYTKHINKKLKLLEQEGFTLNNSRKGSKNEIIYLMKTLEEMGFREARKNNEFTLSDDLLKWLIRLEWPITKLYSTDIVKEEKSRRSDKI